MNALSKVTAITSNDAPKWRSRIEAAFGARAREQDAHLDRGLLTLIEPLIDDARAELEGRLAGLLGATRVRTDLPSISATFSASLDKSLLRILRPTLALELQVAGLRGLAGDTPEARFATFVASLADPRVARAIFDEYPVLARQVVGRIDAWKEAALEVVSRLVSDVRALSDAALLPARGALNAIRTGNGDAHRNGRTVAILEWDDGSKLVYKPRSLAVDLHFGALMEWLNRHAVAPRLRAPRIVDRGDYGWMEHVAAAPCATGAEVARFYARQGAFLALVHVMCGIDIHCENVIACGEHPMLIDLEALMHPHDCGAAADDEADPIVSVMNASVLRVGLLPRPSVDGAVDGSGLGENGGVWHVPVPVWSGEGTDDLKRERRWVKAEPTAHRPVLDGEPVSALAHREILSAAFAATLRVVARDRESLLAPGGAIRAFADDRVRTVLRPTELYGLLLRETLHPDLLRDAADRDRAFDRLWLGAREDESLARAVPAERADLWNGDVPYFSVCASSRDLETSAGDLLRGFFRESPFDAVVRRLMALDHDERSRQEWFVGSALTALGSSGDTARLRAQMYEMKPAAFAGDRASLTVTAASIGDRLDVLALRRAGAVGWLGLTFRQERWEIASAGNGLDGGNLGIALFLARLGLQTSQARYTSLAREALASVLRAIDVVAKDHRLGACDGKGGALFALAHLGSMWSDRALIARAERLLDGFDVSIALDASYDVALGAAGGIRGLLALASVSRSDRASRLAIAAGDHLIAHAEPIAGGLAWRTVGPDSPALGGYAHGASGIAASLVALGAHTGERRFAEAAAAAFRYERSLYDDRARNWRDLRSGMDGRVGTAWCHGAPGIGLARVEALHHRADPELEREVALAMTTTRLRGFGASHCLCHGDLGNLELLLADAERRDDDASRDAVRRIATSIAANVRTKALCGNPHRIETAGLFTGLAGIGYGLLRIADPHRVPSVLSFEPPRGGAL